jgi:thiol:disulfide interchange protein
VAAFRDFLLVRIDMTDAASPENEAFRQRYSIYGLPSVTFLTPDGEMLDGLTVTGFVRAPEFLSILTRALEASGRASGM